MSAIKTIATGKKLSNIYSSLSLPLCKKYGINQTSFDVLMFCANNPENNSAGEICSIRGIKSGIASVAVENLKSKGLLEQKDDVCDRRKHRLYPTKKAEKIISEGRNMQKYFGSIISENITEEEIAVFERINEKIEENIKKFSLKENDLCKK